ncbi:DUF6494 family protein [Kiloniella antarctica]|uniref:DUF6494 family protein n=1 Tax=Kiloniella antarctica TaxID=1550907 RepID=A0ABW5BLK6_9PROT
MKVNEDTLNMSIRKFLKKVGITSQREIEAVIRKGLEDNKLNDKGPLQVSVRLQLPDLNLDHLITGKIDLD